jgi:hypothetical protein
LRVAAVETGDSQGAKRKVNVHCWKLPSSSAVKTVTDKTSLFVITNFKVWSRVV